MLSNGIQLHLESYGKGIAIVCLHGGPGLGIEPFKPALPDLQKRMKVVMFDQRGCGRSQSLTKEDLLPIDKQLADIENVIRANSAGKAILLGHSYGCYLALAFAIKHSDLVSGLALISPNVPYAETAEQLHRWYSHFSPEMKRNVGQISMSNLSPDDKANQRLAAILPLYFYKQETVDLFREKNIRVSGAILESYGDQWMPWDLQPQLIDLNIPISIITGANDLRTPPDYAQEIQRALPQARINLMEKTGHFPFMERPVEFMQLLNNELDRIIGE